MSERGKYAVTQRAAGSYEVWSRCDRDNCDTYHSVIATCADEFQAHRIARALTSLEPTAGQVAAASEEPKP
jgi:hypothetical protein